MNYGHFSSDFCSSDLFYACYKPKTFISNLSVFSHHTQLNSVTLQVIIFELLSMMHTEFCCFCFSIVGTVILGKGVLSMYLLLRSYNKE